MMNAITCTEPLPLEHPGFFRKLRELPEKVLNAVDEYSKPREDTGGDLEKHSYILGTSVTDGIAVMGLTGLLSSVLASKVGIFAANMTDNTAVGVLAGGAASAALGVGLSMVTGVPMLQTAVFSSLLGAYETYRGNPKSTTRDAASGANILSAPFLPGPLKMASAIGAATGTKMESTIGKAIVGGITSGLIAGAIAALGIAPVGIPVAVAASFAAGAVGPFFGPRFSQFFRNLSSDIGAGVAKLAEKVGIKKKFSRTAQNIIGTFPASLVKESIRTYALSDGDPMKTLLACTGEALKQGFIFYRQVKPRAKTQAEAPVASTAASVGAEQ